LQSGKSGRVTQSRSSSQTFLLLGAIIGPVAFTLVYLVLGATQSSYDPWRRPVSDLSTGYLGGIQIASFILCGLSIIGFALALIRCPLARRGRWTPLLLSLVGSALILAGAFVTDPAPGYPPGNHMQGTSLHGAIHLAMSILVFTSLPTACFVTARRWARQGLLTWSAYSLLTGLLMWCFLFAFGFSNARGGPAGLFERMAILTGWAWIAVQAWVLLGARGFGDHQPSI
jgi:hypothetical membrane protein